MPKVNTQAKGFIACPKCNIKFFKNISKTQICPICNHSFVEETMTTPKGKELVEQLRVATQNVGEELQKRANVEPPTLLQLVKGMESPTEKEQQLITIAEALHSNNYHRQLITDVAVDNLCTMLKKNKDYGNSALQRPMLAPDTAPKIAVLVRMSDKITRLINILKTGQIEITDEPISNTLLDMGNYCILAVAAMIDEQNENDNEHLQS